MAIYTNTMRFTGLSGIDTESMVTALMKAEGMRLDKLKQQNQLTLWKQTAYYNITDAFRTFQNSFLALSSANSARLSSTFLRNTSTVKTMAGADSSAVKVTNSSNAEIGKYSVDVKQLATKDIYTGKSTEFSTGKIVSSVDWNDPDVYKNLKEGDSIQISLDGVSKSLKFTKQDIDDLDKEIDTGGKAKVFTELLHSKLDAAFGPETVASAGKHKVIADITDGKLTLTTSKGHTAIIQGGTIRGASVTADSAADLSSLPKSGLDYKLTVIDNGNSRDISFNLNGDMSAADAAAAINQAISDAGIESGLKVSADSAGIFTFSVGNTGGKAEIKFAGGDNAVALEALGFADDVTVEPVNTLNGFGFTAGKSTKYDVTQTLAQAFDIDADMTFEINNQVFTISNTTTDQAFTISNTKTVQDLINTINSANIGVKLSMDALNENFKLESINTGSANKIDIKDTSGFLSAKLGLAAVILSEEDKLKSAFYQEAADARFIFNGVETTRDSNIVDISGIRMELTQVTSDGGNPVNGGPVTITLEKDLSGTLDTVKNFVNAYNTMIDSLNKTMNTNRPKKDSYNYFDPLTDDQKSAMKENDIKNWEDKAQTGLLYNDDLLRGISTSLRSMLYQPVTLSNGTKLSLYEIGITSSNNLSDSGKLIIDENKLSRALETRAGDIAELFTKAAGIAYRPGVTDRNRIAQEGIAERMNDIINNAIGSAGSITRRAGVKGDTLLEMSSSMYRTITDQNNRIADMLTYLRGKETDYYLMFSRMEQAITSANNQMAYLQSQLAL